MVEGDAFTSVTIAVGTLCQGIKGILPIVSFLMIVAAGVIYAAGQLLGAETRARASVWATAMLIGAMIGLLIVVIAPSVLSALYADVNSGVC
ncbi:MAG: hypothetical protein PHS02_02095 [Candidatus ainarchaeum sp.]|nr:hypothetical protein [Candidatus ainarchaeum sp.]